MSNNSSCFSLRISLHVAQLVPLSVLVSVDNARMLTYPDDSSASAISRLKMFAPINQQIHISMKKCTNLEVTSFAKIFDFSLCKW